MLCSDGDSAREQRAARRACLHGDRDRALLPRLPPQQASTRHVVGVAVDDVVVGERLQSAADSARKRGRPVGDAHGCCCCQAAAEERSRLARR